MNVALNLTENSYDYIDKTLSYYKKQDTMKIMTKIEIAQTKRKSRKLRLFYSFKQWDYYLNKTINYSKSIIR